MDIIDRTNLAAVWKWIRGTSEKQLNKREHEMLALLEVLLSECTPYLGGHKKVENALAKFKENMIR